MTVSFNYIPADNRVPLFYAEMDNSAANTAQDSGPSLLIGMALSDSDMPVNQLVIMPSKDLAKKMAGRGSQLARMVESYRRVDPFGELWVIAVPDNGQAATGTITFSGTATDAGSVNLYIGTTRVQVTVASGDTGADAALSLLAAINGNSDLPVTAQYRVTSAGPDQGTSERSLTVSMIKKRLRR